MIITSISIMYVLTCKCQSVGHKSVEEVFKCGRLVVWKLGILVTGPNGGRTTLKFCDWVRKLSESIFRSVYSVYNDLKQKLIHSVVVSDQDIVTFKKTQSRKHYKLLFQRASCVEHAGLHAHM